MTDTPLAPPAPSPEFQPDPANAAENVAAEEYLEEEDWADEEDEAKLPDLPEYAPPPREDRWNRFKMAQFLRHLAATHSVAGAAKAVGMSRQSAYKMRARLKGEPFDIAWETAFRHGYDNLAHAALDRALNGVEVPHYHAGKLVGTSRRYDERLMVALLAMRSRTGAPLMGRYGAAAEYHSERWDALLNRVETGNPLWQFERPRDEDEEVRALRDRHSEAD